MNKLKMKIALKIANFGIWLYEKNMDMRWSAEDRSNVEALWRYRDDLVKRLAAEEV